MPRRKKVKRRAPATAPAGVEESERQAEAPAPRAAAGRLAGKWLALLIGAAVAVPIVVVSVLLVVSRSGGQPEAAPAAATSAGPRAAIVDQLSLTQPNPEFVDTVTDVLEQAGYAVDYSPGEKVSIEFYRTFPAQPYDLLIYRVHSALGQEDGQPADWVTLFTAVPYNNNQYVDEQRKRRLSKVSYYEGGPPYFGIMPEFVRSSMKGNLQGSIVLLMGCDGLATETIAKALVDRGAKAVVSWDGLVSGDHTDAAVEQLLRHLVTEKLTLREAVDKTAAEVGADPTYGSTLRLYPPSGD